MTRVLAVVRVQVLDHAQLYWPWLIMASSFVINLVLWVALADVKGYEKTTGGLAALYVTAAIVAAVGVYQKLPFVLGLGTARRTFLFGTLVYGVGLSALTGIVLLLLNRVEAATGGFGRGGSFFRIHWLTDVPTYQLVPVYAVPMLLALAIGAMFGGVSLRFGTSGQFIFFIALGLAGAAVVVLLTWLGAWPAIGSWLSHLTPLIMTGWLLVPTVLAGAVAWLTLRRAPL